jgi:serine/threonine protein kinase
VTPKGYGEVAHRAAAQAGFAPQLYGVAKINGAPPAYVMEFLSPKKRWVPFERASLPAPGHSGMLKAEIDKFLLFMQTSGLVHGDLRPNNMLLRTNSDSVELRILDWDWAGKHGSAKYPLDRNPTAELLGDAGCLIDGKHDSVTIHKYFKAVRSPSFGSS